MKQQRQMALRLSGQSATEAVWDQFPESCKQQPAQLYANLIAMAARTERPLPTTTEKTDATDDR